MFDNLFISTVHKIISYSVNFFIAPNNGMFGITITSDSGPDEYSMENI